MGSKLRGYVHGGFSLFIDVMHQQSLKHFGIGNVWSLKGILTWTMLGLAVIMNVLVTFYYQALPLESGYSRCDSYSNYSPNNSTVYNSTVYNSTSFNSTVYNSSFSNRRLDGDNDTDGYNGVLFDQERWDNW